jgi:hypothetical protein
MSIQTFIVLVCILLMGMAWYANTSKRDKILIRYRRKNKTLITKFVSMHKKDPQHVIFDNLQFDIIPHCIVFQHYKNGFIHMLFPIFVPTLDFTWNSRYPLDPNTLEPVIISPEVRAVMDKEEWMKSMAKHTAPPSTTKKQTVFQQYLPWILCGVAVLGIFYLYTQVAELKSWAEAMQNNFNAIAK